MFGYVVIDKPEMKIRDYYQYKGYYCGLCHRLREEYGVRGQMALTYDMTFAVILLTSLYEEETALTTRRCLVHPVKKIPVLRNSMTDYGADMNVLLAYYHFVDDWQDEKSLPGLTGVHLFHRKARELETKYPRQAGAFKRQLRALRALEQRKIQDVDAAAGCFGRLMEELFVFRQDEWEERLRRMGFYLGKFIYILDAFEDLPKDVKKGLYNPLQKIWESDNRPEAFSKSCQRMLEMMISECSSAFEQLPCLREADILRNILYSGVWVKYRKLINDKRTDGGIYDNQSI
ncbi:MAG: hypothetical protein HFH60_10390 [Lachnospiraceae bacterium]|nr:hypothetical protein [Lachnospiraceae bacterium]MCI9547077.1 hypothetical protein [Lachnospiraceae bacterium]